jgi:hypothetical protein
VVGGDVRVGVIVWVTSVVSDCFAMVRARYSAPIGYVDVVESARCGLVSSRPERAFGAGSGIALSDVQKKFGFALGLGHREPRVKGETTPAIKNATNSKRDRGF